MKRYRVEMGMQFEDGIEFDVSTAVDADNEEGAKDIARDQLRVIMLDDVEIFVYGVHEVNEG